MGSSVTPLSEACPHCGYVAKFLDDKQDFQHGEHGDFFYLPVKMERWAPNQNEQRKLLACPCCGAAFLEDA